MFIKGASTGLQEFIDYPVNIKKLKKEQNLLARCTENVNTLVFY